MTSAKEQIAAAQAALARNLLSSALALAFPENLATDDAAQRQFLAQAPQLERILAQHNVFDLVFEGKAHDKFLSKLFQLLDHAPVDREVKAAALKLLLVVVEQAPLEPLEGLLGKLFERLTKLIKYIKDAPRVVAGACAIARVLFRSIELFTPEARRELHDHLSRLLPALLVVVAELDKKTDAPLTADELELYGNGLGVFTELLEVSPTSVRSSIGKLEPLTIMALYHPSIAKDASASRGSALCLAGLANASDKAPQMWKQIVDKVIEMTHLHVDLIAGKRMVTAATQPNGLKSWLRDGSATTDLVGLQVYERAEVLQLRLELLTTFLVEVMGNSVICEREVQLVLNDVIALTRRIVTIRAHEIGKQSAISEDGFKLPACVVYGILPRVHALGLRQLSATVDRAKLCALRHASKISRVLTMAAENTQPEGNAALYEAVATCVRALGASALEKLGQPLLEHIVEECKEALVEDKTANKDLPTTDAKANGQDGKGKGGKGKKRKRQLGDLSQLTVDAGADGMVYLSARNQRLLVGNVDAALDAIASCVGVYGSLLPVSTRAMASEVTLLAVQRHAKRRAMSAVSSTRTDAVAATLLVDSLTADSNGAHATNLIKAVDYWSSPACGSPLLQLLALNASEAMIHPRGPPLSINFDGVVEAHTKAASATIVQRSNQALTSTAAPMAAVVRGKLDWEDSKVNDNVHADDDDSEDPAVVKKAKTEDSTKADGGDVPRVVVNMEEEEEEEENFEDERPVVTVEATSEAAPAPIEDETMPEAAPEASPVRVEALPKAAPMSDGKDDDDDDEFPDIVDGDDEDDEE